MKLSKRSEEFIANVRLYLMTSGKNEREIDEVAEELEDHLAELERRGESVERITGGSPKGYLESLEQEMDNDYAGWLKYVPAFLVSFAAFSAMGPAIRGEFSLNIIELIGYPVVAAVVIWLYRAMFRKMASNEWSNQKLFVAAAGLSMLTVVLFIGLIFLGRFLMDPFYIASDTGNLTVIALAATALIACSALLKTWTFILIAAALFLPEWAIHSASLPEETELIALAVVPYLALAAVVALQLLVAKKKMDRA